MTMFHVIPCQRYPYFTETRSTTALWQKLINSHEFIYSHREVSNHNSLPWLLDTDP